MENKKEKSAETDNSFRVSEDLQPQCKDSDISLYLKDLREQISVNHISENDRDIVCFLASNLRDLQGFGSEDNTAKQKTKAHILERLIDVIKKSDRFLWENLIVIHVWTNSDWIEYDTEGLKHLIKITLRFLNVGEVYFHKPAEDMAKEIIEELNHTPNKEYLPDYNYIRFPNGVLNLTSVELEEPQKDIKPKFKISYEYDPLAQCPLFRQTLEQALPQDTAMLYQEAIANFFMPPKFEVIFILYGNGHCGKSTLLEPIVPTLGEENVTSYTLGQITDKDGQAIANMRGKLANIHFESSTTELGNETLLKAYASHEPMKAKVLYKQPITTRNYPYSIVALNNMPATKDHSDGFYRRLKLIPFLRQIPYDKANLDLKELLKTEKAGIMNWTLEGLKRLREIGKFTISQDGEKAFAKYRKESDVVAAFVEDMEFVLSDTPKTLLSQLYAKFSNWCKENGYKSMNKYNFSKGLRYLNFIVKKYGGNQMVWGEFAPDNAPF